MKNRSDPSLRSNANRYGLRSPQAKSSWHHVVGVDGVLPRVAHCADPGPETGLPGAGWPSSVMRRILPLRSERSWAASFAPAKPESPRGSRPASPTDTYKKPSDPMSRSPPLWLPLTDEMLSSNTTSLAGSIVAPLNVNRLTRLTQPPGRLGAECV